MANDLGFMYDADVPWFTKEAIRGIMGDIARIQRLSWPDWPGFISVKGMGDKSDLRPYNPGLFLEGRLPNGDWIRLDSRADQGDNVDAYLVRYALRPRSLVPSLLWPVAPLPPTSQTPPTPTPTR
jgi:hypothetical protein